MIDTRDLAFEIQAAWADPNQPSALFEAAGRAFSKLVGFGLYTVTLIVPGGKEVERLHSTNTAVYPVGGRKPVTRDDYDALVNHGKQPFLARAPAEFASFPDQAVIVGLGLGAVMNLPVIYAGAVLGTVNLLDREGAYEETHLAPAMILAQQILPAMLR
jgi:hypothetical protein